MSSRTIVAGIDSSTQSCKIVRVDADSGEILETTTARHPDGTSINPERWWDAYTAAGGNDLRGIQALSVSAQQHGMVALDAANSPVFDALLWNDTRSAGQALRLTEEYGADKWATEIGVVPVSSITVSKLLWLAENHPQLAEKVSRVLLPHDWLTWKILGPDSEPVTDRSEASGTGYYSVRDNKYRTELLARALGHVPALPRVLKPSEQAGATSYGVVVGAGCADNAGAALGLGLSESEVAVSIGTSGTVFTSTKQNIADPSGGIANFADATGQQLPLLATINGARTIAASATMLNVSLQEHDLLAKSGPADAGGLTFIPYLDGERTPNLPTATGSLFGLTRATMTAENMARASVLGLLCGLAEALERLRSHSIPASRILLIGGGSKSESLRAAAADIFNAEIVILTPREYVALGAARQAAWALTGDLPNWRRDVEKEYMPSPSREWAEEVLGRYKEARLKYYG
jgi:xylulokinase